MRPDCTHLITGGLGAVGLEAARHLARLGARRLVLVGRSGLPPRSSWPTVTDHSPRSAIDVVTELERLGVTVRALSLHITDARAARVLTDPEALGMPPIRGIVHAAGTFQGQLVPLPQPRSMSVLSGSRCSANRVRSTALASDGSTSQTELCSASLVADR
ncbi:ketoreductase domain-containing protein [Streptomyces sp. NPDC050400]|uniref:ketoreductase domain-containing protein n=1 Tax=Streptomyces sp. NPDC050400 TaxID=3365610 RepID=UPI0037AF0D83